MSIREIVGEWEFRWHTEGDDSLLLVSHPEHGGVGIYKDPSPGRTIPESMFYLLARDLMDRLEALSAAAPELSEAEVQLMVDVAYAAKHQTYLRLTQGDCAKLAAMHSRLSARRSGPVAWRYTHAEYPGILPERWNSLDQPIGGWTHDEAKAAGHRIEYAYADAAALRGRGHG